MNKDCDWNPASYMKFKTERTQPSIDLVDRISIERTPVRIVDIGCGPGNSSAALLSRWPESKLVGVDPSPAMIEKAKKDYPGQEWILADAMEFEYNGLFDLVFSNAAIQWIPDHEKLVEKLLSLLEPSGVMAIQLPKFSDMALGKIILSVSQGKRWKKATLGCSELFTYHAAEFYYDMLCGRMKSMEMWETDYLHVMGSHEEIVEWTRSTGLRPYMERIQDESGKAAFEAEVLSEIKKSYPRRKDGRVLFPFKRLFFIGYM